MTSAKNIVNHKASASDGLINLLTTCIKIDNAVVATFLVGKKDFIDRLLSETDDHS